MPRSALNPGSSNPSLKSPVAEYEAIIPRDGTNKMAKLSQKIAMAPLQISLIARLGILDHECEKVAGKVI